MRWKESWSSTWPVLVFALIIIAFGVLLVLPPSCTPLPGVMHH